MSAREKRRREWLRGVLRQACTTAGARGDCDDQSLIASVLAQLAAEAGVNTDTLRMWAYEAAAEQPEREG